MVKNVLGIAFRLVTGFFPCCFLAAPASLWFLGLLGAEELGLLLLRLVPENGWELSSSAPDLLLLVAALLQK